MTNAANIRFEDNKNTNDAEQRRQVCWRRSRRVTLDGHLA